MLLVVIIVAVGAALTLLVGVAMNVYAEALMSRYPQTMELLRRKPVAAAVMIGLLIVAGSVLQLTYPLFTLKSGDKVGAPNRPSHGLITNAGGLSYLWVFAAPSPESARTGYVYNNTQVEIICATRGKNGLWYKLHYVGKDAYINSRFVATGTERPVTC